MAEDGEKSPAICQHANEPSGFKMRGFGQAEETQASEGLWSGQTACKSVHSCGPSLLPCRNTAVSDIVHRTVTRGLTDPFCVSVQWLGHYNGRNEQRNEKREK